MTMTSSSIFALNNHHIVPPPTNYAGPVTASNGSQDNNSKTVNGTVDSMLNGFGTFSKTMEEVNGQKTIDKTVQFANGTSKSIEKTITINDDGSKTITKTGKNGKTSTIQESVVSNSDGSHTVTKEKTKANGATVESVSTTTGSAKAGTIEHLITRTNAQGQTETLDRAVSKTDGSRSVVTTGTAYNGNPIYNETTWNTLA
jgi:hypothetical protein